MTEAERERALLADWEDVDDEVETCLDCLGGLNECLCDNEATIIVEGDLIMVNLTKDDLTEPAWVAQKVYAAMKDIHGLTTNMIWMFEGRAATPKQTQPIRDLLAPAFA